MDYNEEKPTAHTAFVSIQEKSKASIGSGHNIQPRTSEMDRRSRNVSVIGGGTGDNSTTKVKSKSISGNRPPPPPHATVVHLPRCPEGQIVTHNQNPCEPKRVKGRNAPRRKPGFRVPLKKEDGNMESQIIEYNCEFPNRVVVRLEYLMQSTKVRLNDRHYMDDFYGKLIDEEQRVLQKSTRHREKAELNRMKKLIIEGLDKEIPKELAHLNKHPVFRVNQMLNRLKLYETTLTHSPIAEGEEITPVEPYEYNGNKFFKHLHDTGDLWVPSAQALFDEDKLEGKIYRAKLRLLQKRVEATAEEKVLRILNNVTSARGGKKREEDDDYMVGGEEGDIPPPKKSTTARPSTRPSWLVDLEKDKDADNEEDERLNQALKLNTRSQPFSAMDSAVEKIKAKAQKQATRITDKIRRSKDKERQKEELLEEKRHEQEKYFVDTFNYDRARIINRYEKRQRHGRVDDLVSRAEGKRRHTDRDISGDGVGGGQRKAKPYEEIFKAHKDGGAVGDNQIASTKFGRESLFQKLQTVYGVGNTYPFHHYEDYENELILDYLDEAQDGEEMLEAGQNLADMYTRQLMVATEHVAKYRKNRMPVEK